jgi:hypothetical protein
MLLMAAVLLRVTGLDALDFDAKPQPPDRQVGEIGEAVRAWRTAGRSRCG